MNIELPFNVEVAGTGTATCSMKQINERLLTLKGMSEQTEDVKYQIEALERLRRNQD